MSRLFTAIVILTAGCATTPAEHPGVPERTERGYQCSADYACPDVLRCYLRFPSSVGRCVTEEYYGSHPRGCHTDSDCEPTETCEEADFPRHGECRSRFNPTSARRAR